MQFENIIGNQLVKKQLQKAHLSNKLSNTLLFAGSDGIGKSLFAIELAVQLMHPETDIDPSALKKIYESNHPDLHILKPEGKTSMHSISSIRNLIEQVFMAPFEAEAKVFIIHEAERMLPTSANAILKTLEEPTLDSYIILLTSNPDDILPTITSRSIKYSFSSISNEEIAPFLENKHNLKQEDASAIANLSNGSIGKAIELLKHPTYLKKRNLFVNILAKVDISSYYDLSDALTKLEELYAQQTDYVKYHKEVDFLLEEAFMWFRDLHLLKERSDKKYLFFIDKIELLEKQDLSNLPNIETLNNKIRETKLALGRNIKLKTCLENLFLQIDFI